MNSDLFYKNHTIIAAGKRDQRSGEYRPVVEITWVALDGKRKTHSIALYQTCDTPEEASARAINSAKGWIDRHVAKPTRVSPVSATVSS
jgi:hypothetical protein